MVFHMFSGATWATGRFSLGGGCQMVDSKWWLQQLGQFCPEPFLLTANDCFEGRSRTYTQNLYRFAYIYIFLCVI